MVDIQRRANFDSNYISNPRDMEISPTFHTLLMKTMFGTDANTSVKAALLRDGVYDSIGESPELLFDRLEANNVLAGGTNKDRIVIYRKDPLCVCRQLQKEIIRMIPQDWMTVANLTRSYGMFQLQTPVQWKKPLHGRYININKQP